MDEPHHAGLDHRLLKFDRHRQRIDGAQKLDQGAVAGQLDQTPSVFGQNWIKAFNTVLPQTRDCAALVPPHQAGIADRIDRDDCRQTSLLSGQWITPVPL